MKEFESNLDIEKTLEICRQIGRDDYEDESEQYRNDARTLFETDQYERLLRDVDSVVNSDIQNIFWEHSAIAKKSTRLYQ